MTAFRMPSLGADMEYGTLVEWLKKPGDQLKRGDIIAVVETQKGAIEIEVFQNGVLEATHANPGTRVPVGEVLATILTQDERPALQPTRIAVPEPELPAVSLVQAAVPSSSLLKITPAARHRAATLGIDLRSLTPGPDGIVGLSEIETHPGLAPQQATRGINLVEMRKAIATAMARSKREIPHYYVSSIIDMTTAMDWLAVENERRTPPERLLAAVLVVKACALGLRQVPELNGHFLDDKFVRIDELKMGIGIALRGGGLIAPALTSPDTLSLDEIMLRLSDLIARVRSGRLRSSELMEATVTLSNLGDNSVDMVLPVIYPPQVAIIGVGEIKDRPGVANGELAVRKLANFAIAGDHRANDGRSAARFLRHVDEFLQKPEAL